MGGPTGSLVVKGLAYRVSRSQGLKVSGSQGLKVCHICHMRYPPSYLECLSRQDSESVAHCYCFSHSLGVFVFVIVFVTVFVFVFVFSSVFGELT